MATRTSSDGENADSVRIQSQYLRDSETGAAAGPISGFAVLPEGEPLPPIVCQPDAGQTWQDEDLKRAIDAAKAAGLRSYRVEIAPDGTISLIVGWQSAI